MCTFSNSLNIIQGSHLHFLTVKISGSCFSSQPERFVNASVYAALQFNPYRGLTISAKMNTDNTKAPKTNTTHD